MFGAVWQLLMNKMIKEKDIIYKCKNEEGCRDDTVPKQEGTVRWIESMQQSSATPKNKDVGRGLQKIVACSQSTSQCLLVSTVLGMVSSLHPSSFLHLFHSMYRHW